MHSLESKLVQELVLLMVSSGEVEVVDELSLRNRPVSQMAAQTVQDPVAVPFPVLLPVVLRLVLGGRLSGARREIKAVSNTLDPRSSNSSKSEQKSSSSPASSSSDGVASFSEISVAILIWSRHPSTAWLAASCCPGVKILYPCIGYVASTDGDLVNT